MVIIRTMGKLVLGFWLLLGLAFAVGRLVFVENVGGARDKAIDVAEAQTGEDFSHYRRRGSASPEDGTVAQQWEAEREREEESARYERTY
jgi:hypothetical protein